MNSNHLRRTLLLAMVFSPGVLAQAPSTVNFTLAAKDGKTTFRLGEAVEVEFQFTSSVPAEYSVWNLRPNRQVRQGEYDHFTIEPSDSVVDPLSDIFVQMPGGAMIGQPPRPVPLTSTPVAIGLQVNEWLSIRKAGHYRITAETTRVVPVAQPQSPVTVRSNVLEIDVVAPEAGWAEAELRKAVATLEIPDPTQPMVGQSFDPRVRESHNDDEQAAARTLRLLETPEAAAAVARFFQHGPDYAQSELHAGLFASPYRKEVIAAMEAAVAAPDVPISYYYLGTLIELTKATRFGPTALYAAKTPEEIRRWIDEVDRPYAEKTKGVETEYYAKLADAVGRKQGQALAVSLETLVSRRGEPAPPAALAALIANFQSLPQNSQQTFLSSEWYRVASPSMAPLIQSLAEGTSDLRDAALFRLGELDPDAARQIILVRLRKLDLPRQIYGGPRLLLELPDKTLPDLDATLVSALEGNKPGVDVLLARYASEAVAPQLKAWVEQLPQRLCNGPVLPAYFFRVDPDWTSAMMARVRQNSRGACAVNLGSIEDLLMSPGLEKQAIADLSSSNSMILRQAETLLERGGSAAAEKPLLEAFARFHDSGDHASDPLGSGVDQGFVYALLNANRWVPSEETFAKVANLCVTDQCRRQVAQARKAMEQPIPLGVDDINLGGGVIRPYSAEQLRERLSNYPKETQFYLGGNGVGSWYFEQRAAQIGRIVEDAGMKLVDPPPPVRR
jgi:hypothetical protein